MRGDILLYPAPTPAGIADRAIMLVTRSKITHCGLDLGDNQTIDARSGVGVTQHAIDGQPIVVDVRERGATEADITAGIAWVLERKGCKYSYASCANHLLPARCPLFVAAEHRFNCSQLMARYLDEIHIVDLGPLDDNPDRLAPGDIARVFGLS